MGRVLRPLDRPHNGRPARLNNDGYVMIYEPDHPKAIGGGWVLEHRFVVEQYLGQILGRDEHVHHINGVKHDNRLENLEVMDGNDHARLSSQEYRDGVEAMKADLVRYRTELARYREQFGDLDEQ